MMVPCVILYKIFDFVLSATIVAGIAFTAMVTARRYMDGFNNVKSLWLHQFLYAIKLSTHWTLKVHVTWPWPHFHILLTLFNLRKVIMIRSVFLWPCNLGSPYLIYTLTLRKMFYNLLRNWLTLTYACTCN